MTREEILAKLETLSEADRAWVGSLAEHERALVVTLLTVLDANFVEGK